MTTHTPGPWFVGGHPGDHSGADWREVTYDDPQLGAGYICQALKGDARLIAAAPETAAERDRLRTINAELLSALEAIGDIRVDASTDHAQLSALCIAIARIAIAKAKGIAS